MKFFKSFVITILFIMISSSVSAQQKITWPYICYSPLYNCKDNELESGIAKDVLQLIWNAMDGYEHQLQLTTIKRILSEARSGKKQLFYGLYKTPDREKFLYYSVPCRISLPTFLIIRDEDLEEFGGGETISFAETLKDRSKKFYLMQSVSFGKGLDEILEQHKDSEHIVTAYNTTKMGTKTLKMLMDGKIDYALSLDSTIEDARSLGCLDKIRYIPILEQNRYEVGYITAPRTQWGFETITTVNTHLKRLVQSDEFFHSFSVLVEPSQVNTFRSNFNSLIVNPALSLPLAPE